MVHCLTTRANYSVLPNGVQEIRLQKVITGPQLFCSNGFAMLPRMKAIAVVLGFAAFTSAAATPLSRWQIADTNLAANFKAKTRELAERSLIEVRSAEDWKQRAPEMRQQLADMLSLAPLPPRGELRPTITGRIEHEEFTVEKLHFQSLPQLYVTANLYVPKNLKGPAPTVLYVCGHGPYITNGISYGTKVSLQHHAIWFARNGYVCLILDTLESGEILGQHHGTYNHDMWWWNSRGYTPAGVEVWNSMRALDYLSTRPEVDTNRFAITGRSGGGAYSWFTAAMDERIKCAAPVAGITDLENHVVDGTVEGHCDCMFVVNRFRWDYPQVAALIAPRPLLFCNTDADPIFPLDGVVRTHAKIRRVYELLGADEKLGLVVTPGGHKDTQEIQLPVMRWFNQHLRNTNPIVENAAVKLFTPQQLKVFANLPSDAINTNIHFSFVPMATSEAAASKEAWAAQRDQWLSDLRSKAFQAWSDTTAEALGNHSPNYTARFPNSTLFLRGNDNMAPTQIVMRVWLTAKRAAEERFISAGSKLMPAELVFTVNAENEKKQIQIRRRHMLLGETADSVRVNEIVQAIKAIRASSQFGKLPLRVEAEGTMAVNALYASLFAPVDELVLTRPPASHMNGPDYLNILRVLDIPQAVAMASERNRVELRDVNAADWSDPVAISKKFGWEKNLVLSEKSAQQ